MMVSNYRLTVRFPRRVFLERRVALCLRRVFLGILPPVALARPPGELGMVSGCESRRSNASAAVASATDEVFLP